MGGKGEWITFLLDIYILEGGGDYILVGHILNAC